MTLLEGITAAGKKKALRVTDEGDLNIQAGSNEAGSGGDASADNQATQIQRETEIRDRLPSALVGDRLKVDVPPISDAPTNTTLTQILAAIKAQINLAASIWINDAGLYYIRTELVAEGTGARSYAYTDPNGVAASPTGVLRPLASADRDVLTAFYDVLSPSAGYSVGDLLARVGVVDVNGTPPSLSVVWMNLTLGTILATAPVGASVEPSNENVGARQIGNWTVALSTADAANLLNLSNAAIGAPITGAVVPAGGVGWLGWLSAIWKLISDRTPSALISDRFKVDAASSDINATGNITTVDLISAITTGSNNQSIITGNPTANSSVSISANGYNSFLVQVSGIWTGTLQFETSFDGGITWYPSSGFSVGTSYTVNSSTSNGAFRGNATDATNIRVRAPNAITGTANIRIVLSQSIDPVTVRNPLRLFDSVSGVQASIKAANTPVATSDTALVVTECPSAIAPTLNSIILTTANTEYAINITAAKKMAFQILSGGSIRYAWFAGKVSAPILPYGSVQVGIEKAEDLLGKAFTGTLYLASATAGTIVILEQWS